MRMHDEEARVGGCSRKRRYCISVFAYFCLWVCIHVFRMCFSCICFHATFTLSLRLSVSILSMSIHMRFLSSFASNIFDLDLPFHGFTCFPCHSGACMCFTCCSSIMIPASSLISFSDHFFFPCSDLCVPFSRVNAFCSCEKVVVV